MFVVVLALIVAAIWGGIRWFLYSTDQKIAGLQGTIDSANADLLGEDVDRIVDRDTRLTNISAAEGKDADTAALFSQLERLTVPEVHLTLYEYDHEEGKVAVSGLTDNFKFLAQQIISFKSEAPFGNIRVDKIVNTKDGKIAFTLMADIKEETAASSLPTSN